MTEVRIPTKQELFDRWADAFRETGAEPTEAQARAAACLLELMHTPDAHQPLIYRAAELAGRERTARIDEVNLRLFAGRRP